MFKITKWHLNPVNLVCLILLSIVTITVLTSNKPHFDRDVDGVVREYTDGDSYGTHTLTYKDMKDYQIKVEQDGCTFWDGDRFVGYIPYNGTCRLDKLITADNR